MIWNPSSFFDLSTFQHGCLFDETKPVWNALNEIDPYLLNFTHQGFFKAPNGVYLKYPELITIGEGTEIEPGVYIIGPVVIGKNCKIAHGAYLRGNIIAGDRVVIGHDTEVKNAIFFNDAKAAHFAYVGDSILGNGVNLGAGTKCANLRFDHKEVLAVASGNSLTTGRKKLGAIIGDRAQTGCNAVFKSWHFFGARQLCPSL